MGPTSQRTALLVGLLCLPGGCAVPVRPADGGPVDLLVFAPHPDDETLGCAGILLQALERGERVKVVIFTNGDGFPGVASLIARKPVDRLAEEDFRELARFRQAQSQAAFRELGGKPGDLVFLGYPDAGLDGVYESRGDIPFRQKFTGKTETYGAVQDDYHRSVHGQAAPYTYRAVLGDVMELIETLRPRRICVTDGADRHPDHRAAFRFVRDALEAARFRAAIDTYLIHGGPEWPWPAGVTPGSPFESHEVKGKRIPEGVPWPPSRRVALTLEQAGAKGRAIQAQASHLTPGVEGPLGEERAYLESFVKSEEVFWTWERR